jgi:hypothetical protein
VTGRRVVVYLRPEYEHWTPPAEQLALFMCGCGHTVTDRDGELAPCCLSRIAEAEQ